MMKSVFFYDAPFGQVGIGADEEAVLRVFFPSQGTPPDFSPGETPLIRQAWSQLAGYFAGKRQVFDLPLAPRGTEFQRAVWDVLLSIPYGETRHYAEITRLAGRPRAVRAAGQANHRNPLAIIVPCHRVIGADGSLTGYAGGLAVKRWLLDLERCSAPVRS